MSTATPAAPPGLLTKYFAADEVNFTPGERSFVAWVSVEVVDNEADVVVAAGIDFKSVFLANPVLMSIHDYGKWPAGQWEWLKVKTGPLWRGLFGKAVVDDTPDTEVVWQKIQLRTVRGISIGFLPPDDFQKGEWGPPSPDELRKNPHWKGARRVIRRCKMIEASICPIGMNPSALIEAVSKGLHKPAYAESRPMPETPVDEVTDETATGAKTSESDGDCVTKGGGHFITFCSCGAVIAQCRCPSPVKVRTVVENGCPDCKAKPPAAAKAARPASDPDDDGDDDSGAGADDDNDAPIRHGHYVRVTKGTHRGAAGKVKSVHRSGMVPDVEDDVACTKADPGVRLNLYKAMGAGHRETDHHVGVKMAHCEKTEELKPPPRGAKAATVRPRAETETPLPAGIDLDPTDLIGDGEARERRRRQIAAVVTAPEFLKAAVKAALDEVTGVI